MPHPPGTRGRQSAQSWTSFLHNHASAVLACDFFLVVTATFQRLYVFVLLDVATRRVVHWNVTTGIPAEPTRRATQTGHRLRSGHRVVADPRLGGLHHDYRLEPLAA
jgi:hypothetical protein